MVEDSIYQASLDQQRIVIEFAVSTESHAISQGEFSRTNVYLARSACEGFFYFEENNLFALAD